MGYEAIVYEKFASFGKILRKKALGGARSPPKL